MRSPAFVVALLPALIACGEEDARVGARLLVPDNVSLHWDPSFNGEGDGLGALVPVDVMVYEARTGEPMDRVELLLEASDEATWVLLEEDFVVVEPALCGDCSFLWDARRDQYLALQLSERFYGDAAVPMPLSLGQLAPGPFGGALDAHEADLGAEDFLPLAEEEVLDALALPEGLGLGRITLETDLDGLARVYLFVDAFPWQDNEADFEPVSVLVSLGTVEQRFDLVPR